MTVLAEKVVVRAQHWGLNQGSDHSIDLPKVKVKRDGCSHI